MKEKFRMDLIENQILRLETRLDVLEYEMSIQKKRIQNAKTDL